ncbi:MAG: dihydroneopterin triphosphate diphosphatase [Gammaproteobacteria bacterium]|nr:MAG: dihydroneopterin triphosphate diphosphatase [Gammaproteobacteria bacterium]
MYKIPVSVLVIIHTVDLQVLLLERADHPGYWQSVTGSQDPNETLIQTASREVFEETGLNAVDYVLTDWETENRYEIYEEWRWRYGPGIRFNTEHVFGLCLPAKVPIKIAAREHLKSIWLPWRQAAEKVFSSSNAEAILKLPAYSQSGQFSPNQG